LLLHAIKFKALKVSNLQSANLGTLFGVYLPTVQHILGVTMFIRLFWIVGIAGVWHTMELLFLCFLTTFCTCISLSAVATNGEIKSGGAYYMLSRNLGAEFGTAIGLLFYCGNTFAASMYLVGGVEILLVCFCLFANQSEKL
uniref:AA_permease domain-containing protein n=1 Tax=Gongylonema pulchrum TaxID=637853 RepID=A0A183ESK3_9BILA